MVVMHMIVFVTYVNRDAFLQLKKVILLRYYYITSGGRILIMFSYVFDINLDDLIYLVVMQQSTK